MVFVPEGNRRSGAARQGNPSRALGARYARPWPADAPVWWWLWQWWGKGFGMWRGV